MNRIKRFKESTENKSKMDRDLDDLLTKLQFIDETYSMNGDNSDDKYSNCISNFCLIKKRIRTPARETTAEARVGVILGFLIK